MERTFPFLVVGWFDELAHDGTMIRRARTGERLVQQRAAADAGGASVCVLRVSGPERLLLSLCLNRKDTQLVDGPHSLAETQEIT